MERGRKTDEERIAGDFKNKETIQFSDQIVVATNFLYRNYRTLSQGESRHDDNTDGIRGDLALEFLRRASRAGVRIVACDGGSSSDFLTNLEKLKIDGLTLVKSEIAGRAPQRRSAFEAAAALPSGRVIIYTQAEKVGLMDHISEISRPILEGRADIVIPRRRKDLFKDSYPPYMRESEIAVNATYDRLMEREGLIAQNETFDWFFGPVAFRNDPGIVSLFLRRYEVDGSIRSRIGATTDPERNSGSHYFPIIEALFKKKRVVSVEVPFVYPEIQRANEMSPDTITTFQDRRVKDGAAYRLETIHFIALLRGDPRSKIREA